MFKKLTDKLQKNPKAKKLLAGTFAVVMCMTMLAPAAFAEGEVVSASDAATQVVGFLTGDLTLTTILSVIGIGLGASVGLFIGWWAIRKIVKMVVRAFKGKNVST